VSFFDDAFEYSEMDKEQAQVDVRADARKAIETAYQVFFDPNFSSFISTLETRLSNRDLLQPAVTLEQANLHDVRDLTALLRLDLTVLMPLSVAALLYMYDWTPLNTPDRPSYFEVYEAEMWLKRCADGSHISLVYQVYTCIHLYIGIFIGVVFCSICLCMCQQLLLSCHSACHNLLFTAFKCRLQLCKLAASFGSTCLCLCIAQCNRIWQQP